MDQSVERLSEEPDLPAMLSELEDAISDSGPYVEQAERNYNTRMAIWDGQSLDGKKRRKDLGYPPKPWEGASDARIFEADNIINEQVTAMKRAWRSSRVQTRAIRGDSIARSQTIDYLMQWLLRVHLQHEIEREIELAFQWRQTFGLSCIGVYWSQDVELEKEIITLRQMQMAAAQNPQAMALLSAINDPLMEDMVAQRVLMNSMGALKTINQARKLVVELRETGQTEFPKMRIAKSAPCWEALRPWVDIYFPVNTTTLQKAKWVAKRSFMSETELEEKALTEGWDEEWVEEVKKKKGVANTFTMDANTLADFTRRYSGVYNIYSEENEDMVEVFHFYSRGIHEDTGAPATYYTIFSAAVPQLWAKHELLQYKHGKFPFSECRREYIGRSIMDSRSVPELACDMQNKIKEQYDARTDLAQIQTVPPLVMPFRRVADEIQFGPGARFGERTKGEIRFLELSRQPTVSAEVEQEAQKRIDRYFGRASEFVPPAVSSAVMTVLVEDFMLELIEPITQTFQLAQQYLSPVETERVVGGQRIPYQVSREEIAGQYDFSIIISSVDADIEVMKEKFAMLKEVFALDQSGVLDNANAVREAVAMIDPSLADRLIGDPESSAKKEIEDEKESLAMIEAGIEPTMVQSGQNNQLRMRTLMEELQRNPQLMQRIASQPDSKNLLGRRMKYHQFMMQQKQNAQTGRVGVPPLSQQELTA